MKTATVATAPVRQPEPIPVRPKVQVALEYMHLAYENMSRAAATFSAAALECENAANDILHHHDTMVKGIEATGVDVAQMIEHQFRDYIPEKHRNGDNNTGQDNG